jgi:tetratricopeptide (TPR) repeat protein/methyl-accepting chemotaxis protein
MTIRQKLLIILGTSQIMIILSLFLVFKVLIEDVKNHIQDKRLEEHIDSFHKELSHREEVLKLVGKNLISNTNIKNYLLNGYINKNNFMEVMLPIQKIMKDNNINILEIGNNLGIVEFRFHRPTDYGDSKANQKIIQEAINGNISSTLEMGKSGLGLRTTLPFENKGTILLGQTVNRDFIRQIADFEDIKMALYNNEKLLATSDDVMDAFIAGNEDTTKLPPRTKFGATNYYLTNRIYDSHGISNLNLRFFIMVNEDKIYSYVQSIWLIFGSIAIGILVLVSFVGYLFSRDIIFAIRSLNFAMQNIEEDESHKNLDISRRDEIGEMTKVFISMKEEIINHQKNLERIIEKRTSELQLSLNEVTQLKEHQDGDYFLTSLLLKPLISSSTNSDKINISCIIRQKKRFKFKKYEAELGGDLCMVQQITLKNREYTVFINADAMGKSIQGAGGALVLGTVFKSILNRCSWDRISKDKSPERWLYDSYLDLQSVFMSFDGSMIISAIIGLVDNNLGTVYFLNADHPRLVLYRDEKASFSEGVPQIHKIGLETEEKEFKISILQLQSNDVLLLGSDGRDDILLEGETGSFLNENENKFLEFVEKSSGNLDKLEEELLKSGSLIDDLSLMRISFIEVQEKILTIDDDIIRFIQQGEEYESQKLFESAISVFENAIFQSPSNPFILKKLAKLHERVKNYPKTIEYCKKYFELNPESSDFLYYISYYSKILNDYEESIEFGERFRLRDPSNKENLENLSESYRLFGNTERSIKILKLV